MDVTLFNKQKDYEIVKEWWEKRDQAPAGLDMLSDFGVIASIDEKPIAAVWFYPTISSTIGWILSPISNPDSTKEERHEALNACMERLHFIAKELGYKTIFCFSNVEPFQKRLESLGYVEGDKNCIHYWGGL